VRRGKERREEVKTREEKTREERRGEERREGRRSKSLSFIIDTRRVQKSIIRSTHRKYGPLRCE
jgi:hypothetical protein